VQENSAVAILDVEKARFTSIHALGFKDHSLPANALDASDREVSNSPPSGNINIRNWPVFGLYQPDEIASFR
jgi:hypothetical protein